MPEAALYFDDDFGTGEDDVVPAPLVEDRDVQAVAQPNSVKLPTQGQLGFGVSLSLSLHPSKDLGSRRRRDLHSVEKR